MINILLIIWTTLWAIGNFLAAADWFSTKQNGKGYLAAAISFASLFTAILAIGQYL